MPQPGRCFSGYRVEEAVGDSGLTSAWRVTRRGAPLGLRVLAPAAMRWADEFRGVIEAQRALIHPNRLQILDLVEFEGRPAVVTEHIAGPSLATWLKVRRRALDEVLVVFEDVVRGVAAAHQLGVHHLSIDASAISMQSRRGVFVAKVDLALGAVIAAAAADGVQVAPGRLPPPPPLDHRADLYLLGTLLFEMAARRLPVDAADLARGAPRAPELDVPASPEVRSLVAQLLAMRPSARPASAAAVLAALAHDAPSPGIEAPSSTPGRREPDPAPPGRPAANPVLVAAGVAAALVAAGGLVAWLG
jgi:eukaryotic-like serine/threonine-protein kinase